MLRHRRGLYIAIGTGLLVVVAFQLLVTGPGLAATGVSQAQDDRLFIPFVQGVKISKANQESLDAQQTVEATVVSTPVPDEATPPPPQLPTVEPPVIHNFPEETRGKLITVAGKQVQLPEDAYIEGVMVAVEPVPGRTPVKPPVVILRRGESGVAVEDATGHMYLGVPEDAVRRDFAFLIDILGEDNIVHLQEAQATNVPQ
jgi:hypothetical protein